MVVEQAAVASMRFLYGFSGGDDATARRAFAAFRARICGLFVALDNNNGNIMMLGRGRYGRRQRRWRQRDMAAEEGK